MDLSNLNSLKVTDLKQLLKSKGLSIVGTKSQLIQRLESAVLSDPSGDSGVAVSTKEFDEDAILADDDEILESKPDESLLHNEDLLLNETSIETPASSSTTLVATASKLETNFVTTTSNKQNPTLATSNPATKTTSAVSSLKPLTGSKSILTSEEKKQMRLLKFADPKIKNRADRFGTSTLNPMTTTEDGKLKQRMQRFGEVVSQKAKTIDEIERIDKRKERFGLVSSTTANTKSNGFKPTSNSNVNESIQKRQERFGVVNDPPKKQENKILSGFKRRRFAY